jgi:hypothetical protein
MSKLLRYTFLVQAVLAVVAGAALFIAPGRSMGLLDWAPVEPLLFRLLGAALLAMAWTSLYAFRAERREQVLILVQMQAIFCGLGAVGFLRHFLPSYIFPPVVWIVFGVLAIFTVIWVWSLIKK